MTKSFKETKAAERVRGCIESLEFEYAFVFYSSFKEVKDVRFHALRKAYCDARKALAEYVGVEE
jgi:hypothetical protein